MRSIWRRNTRLPSTARCAAGHTTCRLRLKNTTAGPMRIPTARNAGADFETRRRATRCESSRLRLSQKVHIIGVLSHQHRSMMHPKSACVPCGGKLFYDDELQNHYWDSPNHPKCHCCNTGCKDEQNYLEVCVHYPSPLRTLIQIFSAHVRGSPGAVLLCL